MTFVDSWDQSDLESLEREADLRSFALDPAWQDAAVSSRYATPQMLGLREAGSLRAICVGLRRSRAGFSKVVCGTNGGVGILASEPNSATILMRHVWQKWRPSELQVFASYAIPDRGFSWEPSYTTHVDLTLPMEQIIGEFKKRTRKHIERALKEGVTATTAVGREIDDAIELIVRTSRSKHFPLPPREYLLSMHRSFAKIWLERIGRGKTGRSNLGHRPRHWGPWSRKLVEGWSYGGRIFVERVIGRTRSRNASRCRAGV